MSDVKMIMFLEYLKLHETSLEQDAVKIQKLIDEFVGDFDSEEYDNLIIDDYHNTGELIATRHLLSVANDILDKPY